ncbi:MAG: ABC transporter permease [Terriglobia bacterium]
MPLFQVRENLSIAWETVRSNKFRSFLTMLGVVIGVTSVITVAALIQGLNNLVANKVNQLGSRVFFDAASTLIFSRLPEKIRQRKYLRYEDSRAIEGVCPSVQTATAFQQRAVFMGTPNLVKYGNENIDNAILRGVEPSFARVFSLFAIRDGRFISDFDSEHAAKVCNVGAAIVDTLFPLTDPIGKEITVNGEVFTVVGTFERDPGLFGGPGVDQFVVIPYPTFHRMYPEIEDHLIAVSVRDPDQMQRAQDEVSDILRRRRKVPSHEENDFDISSPDLLASVWQQLTGAIVILTLVISSIGLLVGGIGVMNIMLVSVTERTREIGIRKAVGAQRRDILQQFLIEAMTLTGSGGIIGILLGAIISYSIKRLVPSLPAQVSVVWIIVAFAVSVGVGLFFGIFPAKRAAELDPIVSLRYE